VKTSGFMASSWAVNLFDAAGEALRREVTFGACMTLQGDQDVVAGNYQTFGVEEL